MNLYAWYLPDFIGPVPLQVVQAGKFAVAANAIMKVDRRTNRHFGGKGARAQALKLPNVGTVGLIARQQGPYVLESCFF